jgi:hypothetical protein
MEMDQNEKVPQYDLLFFGDDVGLAQYYEHKRDQDDDY